MNIHLPKKTNLNAIQVISLFVVLVFILLTAIFTNENSHFIGDDFDHFTDAIQKSAFEMMRTNIDVHFVPFHKLSSYLIFKADPLNFTLALTIMTIEWIVIMVMMHFLLLRVIPKKHASIITILIGSSPVWIHVIIWWSAAAHRFPYFILQAAVLFTYFSYRENKRYFYFLAAVALQTIAIGFYVKAILFPVIIAGLEVCLAFQSRKISRESLKLCVALSLISALYAGWYLLSFNEPRVGGKIALTEALAIASLLTMKLGALLIFLPIDSTKSEYVATAIFAGLAIFSIWRKPKTVVPIIVLLGILFFSSTLNAIGRGILISFSFGSMRYFSEDIIIIGLFIAIIISQHLPENNDTNPNKNNKLIYLGLFAAICYSAMSFAFSTNLFNKIYNNHIKTHKYMTDVSMLLETINEQNPPVEILKGNLPAFAYGFLGSRKEFTTVFSHLYPNIKFVSLPNATKSTLILNDDTSLSALPSIPVISTFKEDLNFPEWQHHEDNHRWSNGNNAIILFTLDPNHKYEGILRVYGPILGTQRVNAFLNGHFLKSMTLVSDHNCCEWTMNFPPEILIDGTNQFHFELPDAQQPPSDDSRILAIGVSEISIR